MFSVDCACQCEPCFLGNHCKACCERRDVITWLRSPDGEKWCEARIYSARLVNGNAGHTLVRYGPKDELWMGGVLSVKEDYREVQ